MATRIPGAAIRSVIPRKTRNFDAPASRAASSRFLGTAAKAAAGIQVI